MNILARLSREGKLFVIQYIYIGEPIDKRLALDLVGISKPVKRSKCILKGKHLRIHLDVPTTLNT